MFGGDVCCPSSVNCHLKLGVLFCIVEGIVSGYLVSSDKGKMATGNGSCQADSAQVRVGPTSHSSPCCRLSRFSGESSSVSFLGLLEKSTHGAKACWSFHSFHVADSSHFGHNNTA